MDATCSLALSMLLFDADGSLLPKCLLARANASKGKRQRRHNRELIRAQGHPPTVVFHGREAPTSIARPDAGGVHPENPWELLDVPHILRKLKMRRYEGHFSDQKGRAF